MKISREEYIESYKNLTAEEAIDHLTINNWLPIEGYPFEKLLKLIEFEIGLALDPRISQDAVDLIKKYGGTYTEGLTNT